MARQVHDRDISKTLAAAQQSINTCLVEDFSLFSQRIAMDIAISR
jgi:hypothetical protein